MEISKSKTEYGEIRPLNSLLDSNAFQNNLQLIEGQETRQWKLGNTTNNNKC